MESHLYPTSTGKPASLHRLCYPLHVGKSLHKASETQKSKKIYQSRINCDVMDSHPLASPHIYERDPVVVRHGVKVENHHQQLEATTKNDFGRGTRC